MAACGGGGGSAADPGPGPGPGPTAPSISTQPANRTTSAGSVVTLSAAATGAAPLTYQWQRNGVDVPGATAATYTFTCSAADNGAAYRVVVRNSAGTATSNVAVLTVTVSTGIGRLNGYLVSLADASTTTAGTASVAGLPAVSTSQSGTFFNFGIANVPASERIALRTSKPGHLDQIKVAAVRAGAVSFVRSSLNPVDGSATVDPAAGGSATLPGSTAQITFPPAALVRADNGGAPSGAATVSLTLLNGARDPDRLPGDGTALSGGGALHLDSLGGLAIVVTDNAGQRLRLANGASAEVRVPYVSRDTAAAPATAGLYLLDEADARWVAAGSATLAGIGALRHWQASVTRLDALNVARPVEVVQVSGCTQFQAGRTRNRSVRAETLDAALAGYAFTDANGNFAVSIRKGARAALFTTGGTESTAPVMVGPSDSDITLPACLIERGSIDGTLPSFVTPPASQSVAAGATVRLNVVVDGELPIAVQWQRNGAPLPGENGTALTFVARAADDGAQYTVQARNGNGTVLSTAAVLSVSGSDPVGTGPACFDGLPAEGSRFAATYDVIQGGVRIGTRSYLAVSLGATTFDGQPTRLTEVTNSSVITQGGRTVSQSSFSSVYGSATGPGQLTRYGQVSSGTVSTGSTTQQVATQIAYTPPFVDRSPGMGVGEVLLQTTITRVTSSTDGVATPPFTSIFTQALTYWGIETLVIPAGTFQACRYTASSAGGLSEYWSLAGRGETLKTIVNNEVQQATQVTVTP